MIYIPPVIGIIGNVKCVKLPGICLSTFSHEILNPDANWQLFMGAEKVNVMLQSYSNEGMV